MCAFSALCYSGAALRATEQLNCAGLRVARRACADCEAADSGEADVSAESAPAGPNARFSKPDAGAGCPERIETTQGQGAVEDLAIAGAG